MAYMQNIGTFVKTLQIQTEGSSLLNAKLARAAVTEIERSLDQMDEHHISSCPLPEFRPH